MFFWIPVVSIEDPFDQDDWEAWTNFTESTDIQVVGDDLTVTNPSRICKAVEENACNCLLLKVNQIGTVTESMRAYVNNVTVAHSLCCVWQDLWLFCFKMTQNLNANVCFKGARWPRRVAGV